MEDKISLEFFSFDLINSVRFCFYLHNTHHTTTTAIVACKCWRRCFYLSRKLNNKRQRGKKASDAKKKDIVRFFFSFELINPVLQFKFYLHNTHHTTTTTIVVCSCCHCCYHCCCCCCCCCFPMVDCYLNSLRDITL